MSLFNDLFAPIERHPRRVLICIGLLFVVLYVSSHTFFPRAHGRIVNGDAIQYYAYLRSLAIDGDLDFTNDYQILYGTHDTSSSDTATGRPPNIYSIGPALLWSPFFLQWESSRFSFVSSASMYRWTD